MLDHNKCYNYTNDVITNTFAQPGRGSRQPFGTLACSAVEVAAKTDGLIGASNPDGTPVTDQFVAPVIWLGFDFHRYR